ncbi:MAG: twin-arginine translocase TatA/TatE family subunit [Ktedonobacteraceae bacterium]|nr:twin-arginine translocase TatA/TatE family subunit [Ktedonobacteraceae bacterium]
MGHFLEIFLIVLIGLALFGPKMLQSMAREAGKTIGQVKSTKKKVMDELPVEELAQVANSIPQMPLNSRDVLHRLTATEEKTVEKATAEKSSKAGSREDAPGEQKLRNQKATGGE